MTWLNLCANFGRCRAHDPGMLYLNSFARTVKPFATAKQGTSRYEVITAPAKPIRYSALRGSGHALFTSTHCTGSARLSASPDIPNLSHSQTKQYCCVLVRRAWMYTHQWGRFV